MLSFSLSLSEVKTHTHVSGAYKQTLCRWEVLLCTCVFVVVGVHDPGVLLQGLTTRGSVREDNRLQSSGVHHHYLSTLLTLLDGVFVELVKLPGIKLGEFRDKYPQVSEKQDNHSRC